MTNQLRKLNFHEISKIFAFCIEKSWMDVNVKDSSCSINYHGLKGKIRWLMTKI